MYEKADVECAGLVKQVKVICSDLTQIELTHTTRRTDARMDCSVVTIISCWN